MRLVALLLLLLNVLAFAYWQNFDPPPPPQPVHISNYYPKGVAKLPLVSETLDQPSVLLAEATDVSPTADPAPTQNPAATPPAADAATSTAPAPVPAATATPSATDAEPPAVPAVADASAVLVSENSLASDATSKVSSTLTTAAVESPAPLAVTDKVAQSLARVTDFRLTNVQKTEHKNLLSSNAASRQFLEGGASPPKTASTAPEVSAPVMPYTQFQPVARGTSILQVPPVIAHLAVAPSPTTKPQPPSTTHTLGMQSQAKAAPLKTPAAAPVKSAPVPVKKAQTAAAAPSKTQKNAASTSKNLCFRSGAFSQRDNAEQARAWLQKQGIGASLKVHEKREKVATWLYLPPFQTRALARQAAKELARRGVRDYSLVTQAPWINAISLGLFTGDTNAQQRLAELQRKGYYSVRVQHRYKDQSNYWLMLKLAEKQRSLLKSFANTFKVLAPQQVNCQ